MVAEKGGGARAEVRRKKGEACPQDGRSSCRFAGLWSRSSSRGSLGWAAFGHGLQSVQFPRPIRCQACTYNPCRWRLVGSWKMVDEIGLV